MTGLLLAALFTPGPAAATSAASETVDRVVASIGNAAITQADVEAEYRFELFLDGKTPASPPDQATLVAVRDRLIEQRLLGEEAAAEAAAPEDFQAKAAETLNEIRKRYGSEEAFNSALHSLGMDRPQLLARIAQQEKVLRMVEERFRPAAWPEPAEVEAYYRDTFVPEYTRRGTGPPPALPEVENKIKELLIEKKIDRLLEAWLEEMKSGRRVRIHEF